MHLLHVRVHSKLYSWYWPARSISASCGIRTTKEINGLRVAIQSLLHVHAYSAPALSYIMWILKAFWCQAWAESSWIWSWGIRTHTYWVRTYPWRNMYQYVFVLRGWVAMVYTYTSRGAYMFYWDNCQRYVKAKWFVYISNTRCTEYLRSRLRRTTEFMKV